MRFFFNKTHLPVSYYLVGGFGSSWYEKCSCWWCYNAEVSSFNSLGHSCAVCGGGGLFSRMPLGGFVELLEPPEHCCNLKPQHSANSSGDYLKKPVAAKGAVSCYKICCTQKHLEPFLICLHRKCFHQRTDSHKHALYKHITGHICQQKVFRLYTLSISGNPVFLKYANSANYCGGIGRKRTTVWGASMVASAFASLPCWDEMEQLNKLHLISTNTCSTSFGTIKV